MLVAKDAWAIIADKQPASGTRKSLTTNSIKFRFYPINPMMIRNITIRNGGIIVKNSGNFVIAGIFAILLLAAGPANADDGWVRYTAEDYGFTMFMPEGTVYAEREGRNGWAELAATYDGVDFYALTKRGEQASAEEIERVGVALTGLPDRYWKTVNSGRHQNGWNWYRTVEASDGDTLIVGDYGTGPSGSYLLIVVTTEDDYFLNKSDYIEWYNSIRLF